MSATEQRIRELLGDTAFEQFVAIVAASPEAAQAVLDEPPPAETESMKDREIRMLKAALRAVLTAYFTLTAERRR